MSTEDDARSGRPKEAVTDENIKKVHKIIFDNRKVKLIEIAEGDPKDIKGMCWSYRG